MQGKTPLFNGSDRTVPEETMRVHSLHMSEVISSYDWSASPLGHVAGWPDTLKATVRILITSRFPMWMAWGPQNTFLYNDAYARTTLGKKHPWALGRPASEVWHEIWSDIGPLIERVLKTGEATWEETLQLILERDGYREETYHTFSYSPLADADGQIKGMLCVVMEDTGRVLGERQLSSLTKLASALVDANSSKEVFESIESGLANQKDIPFGLVYLFDESGSKLNLVACSGISPGHPAARPEIFTSGDKALWPVNELLLSNQPITVENLAEDFPELPTGAWDRPPTQARLVPITRRGQEKPAGVFIASLNPYRQLNSGYAEFLNLAAGQIAASITNAEAYETERKRAEALAELDLAKTAFFSNVSHELRTPLTLILGPIEDALTSETPPSPQALEMLHRNALRLLKLVNGLLDFVRIEVGRMRAAYEPTDLSLFTAQLASVFRSAVERAGLKLTVDCSQLTESVYVDREMWEKVVLNLLSNALKSTFEGEIRVAMSSDSAGAQLTVSDTGTGIPECELPHIFERFRRIEEARRRSHEGSGIGLALVRELIEMHGGTISVESQVGKGTTFTVHLPFGRKHLPVEHVVEDAVKPVVLQGSAVSYVHEALGWLPGVDRLKGEITRSELAGGDKDAIDVGAGRKPVVVLADDNADMREYVLTLLSGLVEVVPVVNGRRALEAIEKRLPDLVLTDVMMPEMDGFALLAALRGNPVTAMVPVIMLSARAGVEARIDGIDAGADDYLTKPFTARELIARVEAQLKMARLRKDAVDQRIALTREIDQAKQFAWGALEHIPDSFGTLDSEYRITYVNPSGARISASINRPLIGESLWDLYPMLKGTPVETNFRRAMEERVPVEFEQYFQTDDAEQWFQFKIYPQPAGGVILYLRDATEARRTEQALRRSEQLAAVGRLAASIAHEINNPLEAVTNLLFLAKADSELSTDTKHLLEVADKELQRLSHITARSLKFYRQRTAPTLTLLDEVLDSVIYFHDPSIRIHSTEVDRRYRMSPPVLCLPGEIQQVFTNLISNALDALSKRGRLIVSVRAATGTDGRTGVRVTVADNGCGMEMYMFDRLFHPFVTTKGEAGTGLGLWVSKGILDKHHATINVRSRPGSGTVFRLFFPLDTTLGDAPVPQ